MRSPRGLINLGGQMLKASASFALDVWPQPSGATERFTGLPIDKYIVITEGDGVEKA